ncbi:MAG TPA: F0F1 ATP synthase subunit A [Haloplasmataceae bacterium]
MFRYNEETGKYVLKGTEQLSGEYLRFELTSHVTSIIILTVALLILFFLINRRIRKADPLDEPKGLLFLAMLFYTIIDNFTQSIVGKSEKLKGVSSYVGLIVLYLFLANTIGLFGFTPPTSSLNVTVCFGLMTFLVIKYYGLKTKGIGHITGLFQPIFLTPVNLMGEISLPFSLSMRLFGNILSGVTIMTIIYTLILSVSQIIGMFAGFTIIIPLMHGYFDIFSGAIQTLLFTLISTVYIANATAD